MFGFDVNKFKPSLKMAVQRIQLHRTKRTQVNKQAMREVANLLADRKEEKARIRVEGIINDDNKCEALEILALLCDLLCERAALIKAERNCPYDMKEAVYTLIWAADRSGIPELLEVRKQLTKKYGGDIMSAAMQNKDNSVNEKVRQKLSIQPPSAALVQGYLKEIAATYNVDYTPSEEPVDPIQPTRVPIGRDAFVAPTTGLTTAWSPVPTPPPQKPDLFPSLPTTQYPSSYSGGSGRLSGAPASPPIPPPPAPPSAGSDLPDFDELESRFAALRSNLPR